MHSNYELVEKFLEQEQLFSFEGRRGVLALCKLARALGYKDENYFGQLDSSCSIGDLIQFFEDNSGAVGAVVEWIGDRNIPEHGQALSAVVQMDDEDDDE